MELDNIDVLLGMTIGCIILGIGLSLFFTQSYTGYGAVVLAIGMMTLSLMITARPRVIERVKRENMLQPMKQPTPTPPVQPAPPANFSRDAVAPQTDKPAPTPAENNEHSETKEAPHAELSPAATEATPPTTEPSQPQAQESVPEQKQPQEAPVPAATPA